MKTLDKGWISAAQNPPQPGHSVIYRTRKYHAFGFVDPCGRWMSFEGRVEPQQVLAWMEKKVPAS